MGFTKAQLANIMMHRAQAFIPKDRLNYAGRVAATYLRKKIYRWEDKAALANYGLLQSANRDIRDYALNRAGHYGVSVLGADAKTIPFRRDLIQYSSQRLNQYAKDVAHQSFDYASTAYKAGWYGSQWLIDQTTHDTHKNDQSPLPYLLMLWTILHPGVTPNLNTHATYGDLATEWGDAYTTAVLNALLKEKQLINVAVSQNTDVVALLANIANMLGVGSSTKLSFGLYHATDVLTRTAVMRGMNQGSAAEYRASPLVSRVMWVTSHDNRVCPECQSHEGEIFEVDEGMHVTPLVGLPPDGSHPNCRCTVIPVLPENEKSTEPPENTFGEWLGGQDKWYTLELGEFMQDTSLESTQL